MPSAQVIDFGADPYANAMGGFAKNFLTTINEKTGQRRNEDLFRRISDNYGPDANPEDIFKDVLKAEGMDQDYKRNKLAEIKEYATLASKAKLNGYEAAKLDVRRQELASTEERNKINAVRADNEKKRNDLAADKAKKDLPKQIAAYTANALKTADVRFKPDEKTALDVLTREKMDGGMQIDEALKSSLAEIEERKNVIESGKVALNPGSWSYFNDDQALQQAKQQAVQQLLDLVQQYGITSQTDLGAILDRSEWKGPEKKEILQHVMTQLGRKLREPKKQDTSTQDAEDDSLIWGQ